MKITPKDYVKAYDDLARAGFKAIKSFNAPEKSDHKPTNEEVAGVYGISTATVELVATISSFSEYQTIRRLEIERDELQVELNTKHAVELEKQAHKRPKAWHYAIASLILAVGFSGLIWGLVILVNFIIRSLF